MIDKNESPTNRLFLGKYPDTVDARSKRQAPPAPSRRNGRGTEAGVSGYEEQGYPNAALRFRHAEKVAVSNELAQIYLRNKID